MQSLELVNIEIENIKLNQIIVELQKILSTDLQIESKMLWIELLKKTPAILIGGFSGFPYLNAGTGLAGTNTLLRILLTYGTIVGIAYLSSYVLINLTQDLEHELTFVRSNNKKFFLKKIITFSLAMCCGVITAAPSAYVGYKYNNKSFGWMLSALITDSILYSYSVKQLIFRYNYKQFVYFTQKNYKYSFLSKIKFELNEMLKISSKKFTRLPELMNEQLVDNAINLNNVILSLLKLSNEENIFSEDKRMREYFFIRASKVLSLTFALTWEIVNFMLSYYGFSLLTRKIWIIIPLAFFPVLLSTILQYDLGSQTFISIQKNIRDYCGNGIVKSFSHFYYSRIFLGFGILGILTAILSLGTRAKITTDTISGLLGILLAISVSISTAAYKITAIFKINENLIQYGARCISSENHQAQNNYYKITRLINYINLLSLDDFDLFLKHIDINSITNTLKSNTYLNHLLKSYHDLDLNGESHLSSQINSDSKSCFSGLNKFLFWNKKNKYVVVNEIIEDKEISSQIELKNVSI